VTNRVNKIRPGVVIDDRFQIRSKIGAGSFGMVYFANDLAVGNMEVALKILKPSALGKGSVVKRFEREARVANYFDHPHIIRCHYVGRIHLGKSPQAVPYMALDLVRGLSLGDIIRARGPLWVSETVHALSQVLQGLQAVHERGYVHRDLKPDNILVAAPLEHWTVPENSGSLAKRLGVPEASAPLWRDITTMTVRLADFGLAKKIKVRQLTDQTEEEALTREGQAAGTAEYMSPEQVLGSRDLDCRTDLYSCGVLIYRLITGWAPYRGVRQADIALKHLTESLPVLPPPLSNHPLNHVYKRAGERDRDSRYGSAVEMQSALRRALSATRSRTRTSL